MTLLISTLSYLAVIMIIIVAARLYRNDNKVDFDEKKVIDKISDHDKETKYQLDEERKVLTKAYKLEGVHTVFIDTTKNAEEEKIKPEDIKSQILDKPVIYEANSIAAIKEDEKTFDAELFKKWCKELFKCIKQGDADALEIAKKFMKEELYDSIRYNKKQLEKDGLVHKIEDLFIDDVKILDYGRNLETEEIKVVLVTNLKEYILDTKEDKVVRGSDGYFTKKNFVLTFSKRDDIKEKLEIMDNCPSCGAKIEQLEFGRCSYCGTLIFPVRYNWTLQSIETI